MADVQRQRDQPAPVSIGGGHLPPGAASDGFTVREAATLLGIHERSVRRAIARGDLAATRRGPAFIIAPDALAEYRAQSGQDSSPANASTRRGASTSQALAESSDEPVTLTIVPLPFPERSRAAGLPASLTPFIGREDEVAAAATLLQRTDVRMVTLTGPGGSGKTRLGLRAAERLAAGFADGVTFVPLASIAASHLVMSAILLALGTRDGLDGAPLEQLLTLLEDQERLIVLDNVEHVVGVGPELMQLLAGCPGVKILATSRIPLRVSGERLFAVPPLSLPPLPQKTGDTLVQPGLDELARSEAIRLFVDRAQAVDSHFALTAANAPVIAEICARVDGLPLAIELAAARAATLSPASLLNRLDRRLQLLTDGPLDQPDRLQTMRGAIGWSWDLLSPPAQVLLSRLSVFTGGIDLTGAEAMANLDRTAPDGTTTDQSEQSAPGLIAALVDAGLLQRGEDPDGAVRFGMLETVREYGLEQLRATGDEPNARAAHASILLEFIEGPRGTEWTSANEETLDRIEREHDNLRAALSWSLHSNPETALRLATGVARFWSVRSYWNEGRDWLERTLASGAGSESLVRATALGHLGSFTAQQGDFETAQRHIEASLAISEKLGDELLMARARRELGIFASETNDFDRANAFFEQAMKSFQTVNNRKGVVQSLSDIGLVAHRQADYDRAVDYLEQAVPLARESGDQWLLCIVLGNLGGAYFDRGDFARGEVLTEEALLVARRLGDNYGICESLYSLGNYAIKRKDPIEACAHFREALLLARELGEQALASRAVDRIGAALQLHGQPRPAARMFGAGAAIREAAGISLFANEEGNFALERQQVINELGEMTYRAIWDSGHTLTIIAAINEAIAFAGTVKLQTADTRSPAPADDHGLTAREIEVLRLLVDGKADKEIASLLFVARTTASKHVAAIIAKFGVESRTAAVAQAMRIGLI